MPKNTLNCIIVDDDTFSRETLEDLLGEIKDIKILKSLSESSMAIKFLATLKPDIAFLDINMPKKDGISILNEINDLGIATKVVFVTSHEQYIMDALKKDAFDYLIKPVKKSDIEETLSRFLQLNPNNKEINETSEASSDGKIVIQNAHGTLLINAEDIVYIKADGCYTQLHLSNNKTEIISKNLGRIESLFSDKRFFKISRSYIVNINFLNKIDRLRKTIQLNNNGSSVLLKASKNQLYDLESLIHKR